MGSVRNEFVQRDVEAVLKDIESLHDLFGKRILITGASGFLGGAVLETLAHINEVHVRADMHIYAHTRDLDKLYSKCPHLVGRGDIEPVVCDIRDLDIEIPSLDIILHAASIASPEAYLSAPVETVLTNTIGTHKVLELARLHDAKVVFFSSGVVYGSSDAQVMLESTYGVLDPLHPRACYSESKRLAETLCISFWRQYGVSTVIARISHTYGPGLKLSDDRVFSDFIKQSLRTGVINLASDGKGSRPFCYITDMIIGLFLLIQKGRPGEAYNLGSDREIGILELAELIASLYPLLGVTVSTGIESEFGIRDSGHFDISKMRELGWEPRVEPRDGFRRLFDYLNGEYRNESLSTVR